MDELGKIVRPQSPTRTCSINPEDSSHIGLILSETKVKDKTGERLLGLRTNEIVCALSSKTIYLSNTGQIISNIDLPYYWCNFCSFKTEDKHQLLKHLMEHRFSCQFCVFQTFSRVDVVRHTVKEHKTFDCNDLKFCVLLPDLLKHGLKDTDASKEGVLENNIKGSEEGSEIKLRSTKRRRKTLSASKGSKKRKDEVKTVSDNLKTTTPGVCFECRICQFRTFKKPVLIAHNNSEHDSPRPAFFLKIVSRSQGKEIEDCDNKTSVKRRNQVSKKPKLPVENRRVLRSGKNLKVDVDEEMEQDEDIQTPEIELDYAEEDDEDNNDAVTEGDNNEEIVPGSMTETTPIKTPIPVRELNTGDKNNQKKLHKCLLCRKKASEDFTAVKDHYLEEHPGGTLVMSEVLQDGAEEKWSYFCSGNDCDFRNADPLLWLNHCLVCQKDGFGNPDPNNTGDQSLRNTANTVRENMGLPSVPEPREPLVAAIGNSSAVLNIKQESPNQTRQTANYSLGSEAGITLNTAINQTITRLNSVSHGPPNKSCQPNSQIFTSPASHKNLKLAVNQAQACPKIIEKLRTVIAKPGASTFSQVASNQPSISTEQLFPESQPITCKEGIGSGTGQAAPVNMISIEKHKIKNMHNAGGSGCNQSSGGLIHDSLHATAETVVCSIPIITSTGNQSIHSIVSVKNNPVTSVSNQHVSSVKSSAANQMSSSSITEYIVIDDEDSPEPAQQSNFPLYKSGERSSGSISSTTESAEAFKRNHIPSPTKQAKSRRERQVEESELFDVDQAGNYKCSHCRFHCTNALDVRSHMVERHRMNPLYGVDMMAEVKNVPRFMLFCPKDTCNFCTKEKDIFLKHFEECTLVDDGTFKITDEYIKRVEVTRNFVNKTLQKLMNLAQLQ